MFKITGNALDATNWQTFSVGWLKRAEIMAETEGADCQCGSAAARCSLLTLAALLIINV